MEELTRALYVVVGAISRLLDPVLIAIDEIGFYLRQQLSNLRIRYDWQFTIILVLWVVLILTLIRFLQGWYRIVLVVFVALVLAKIYGLFPS